MEVKDTMISTNDAQQFGQLRARIEATFAEPALIVVTSAAAGDGKSATAFGLAAALAEAEHRVLLIDANVKSPTLSRLAHRPVALSRTELAQVSKYAQPVAGERFKGLSFADERLETGLSMEKIRVAMAELQAHFDYIVVDTAPVTRSNLAVLFATVAEGTMLTIRLGRLGTTADDEAIKTLTRVGSNTLGALTLTPKMIKAFRDRVATPDKGIVFPPRHITTRHSAPSETSRDTAETAARSSVVS